MGVDEDSDLGNFLEEIGRRNYKPFIDDCLIENWNFYLSSCLSFVHAVNENEKEAINIMKEYFILYDAIGHSDLILNPIIISGYPYNYIDRLYKWAAKKGIDCYVPAQQIAIIKSNDLPETESNDLSETERNNLLKQIGGLALVLAEKNNRYKKGDTLSANAIAESVIEIIDTLQDANKYGLGKTSIRKNISSGLKLIIK